MNNNDKEFKELITLSGEEVTDRLSKCLEELQKEVDKGWEKIALLLEEEGTLDDVLAHFGEEPVS